VKNVGIFYDHLVLVFLWPIGIGILWPFGKFCFSTVLVCCIEKNLATLKGTRSQLIRLVSTPISYINTLWRVTTIIALACVALDSSTLDIICVC
jgi:hypothetical protein